MISVPRGTGSEKSVMRAKQAMIDAPKKVRIFRLERSLCRACSQTEITGTAVYR
jgi:hypothetical protein